MGMAFSWRGCSLQTISPVGRSSPLLRTRGYLILWENRSGSVVSVFDPDRCVVGSSPTCGTEHFGFPPSAPRLGNQRPWYVQPRLCDWAYKRSCATYRKEKGIVSRWSVSSEFHPSNNQHRTESVIQLYVLALKMALDFDRVQNPHSKTYELQGGAEGPPRAPTGVGLLGMGTIS